MSGLKCGDNGGEIAKNLLMRLFLICRRRRRLKLAPNLTILFPRPPELLNIVNQAKNCCAMTCRWSAAAAVTKSTRICRYFADFRGDGGRLPLRVAQKVHFHTSEVDFWRKNDMKRAFREKFNGGGGQMRANKKKASLLWAASTAANVTNARFKSSTVPLQTTLLTCEPSQRKRKEMAAVLVIGSRNYRPPCMYIVFVHNPSNPIDR